LHLTPPAPSPLSLHDALPISTTRRVVFRHPLTRSAVVELSTAEERRDVHRALARARRGEPERQAWHLGEASVEPDARVAEMHVRSEQAPPPTPLPYPPPIPPS